jgi:serine/threonine-protein phosphatase 2A regulatory subunit B''
VTNLIEDAQGGKPIKGPSGPNGSATPLSPTTAHAIFSSSTVPPLSPVKCRSPRSPLSPARRPLGGAHLKRSPLAGIPQFYYPSGREPLSDDARSGFAARVDALFAPHPGGLNLEQFSRVVQEVCALPTILAHPWFERLVAGRPARLVERAVFEEWWASRGLIAAPASKRLWEVLRPEGRHYLTYDDFKPLLQVGRGAGPWGRERDGLAGRAGGGLEGGAAAPRCMERRLVWVWGRRARAAGTAPSLHTRRARPPKPRPTILNPNPHPPF